MSVSATGGVPTSGAGEEVVELPHGDAAFGALMDALVTEEAAAAPAGEAAGSVGAPAGTTAVPDADANGGGAAATGQPAEGGAAAGGAAGAEAGAGGADAGAAPGADGAAAGGTEQPAAEAGAGDRPAAWTADAATLVPKLGELSTKLEENTTKAYQQKAFTAVREEHGQYFEALEKHPRLLVGTSVPAIGKEGMETLRDTNDAREWQEAVKSILVAEVRDRAGRQMEESADFLQTVHASIELFQNNADLVPGTKTFDTELANRFATLAKPYELRVDGKLQGYSIPVQPIIDQLRDQVTKERAKTAAPAATTTAASPPGAAAGAAPAQAAAAAEPPQAGIPSKAGNSSDKEDFSTLFGTIGLPNIQI